jgi:hypothetical protein
MVDDVVLDPAAVQRAWAPLVARAREVWHQRPEDPAGIAELLQQMEMLMLEISDVEEQVNQQRYAAEVEHSKAFSVALADFWAKGRPVSVARAMATTASLEEKRVHNEMRALWHHVDRVAKALASKHVGYMARNKNLEPLVRSWGRR